MLICTSICANYLSKAMVLADSVKKTNPSIKFMVCLLEKKIPSAAKDYKNFDYIVLAKDLGFSNFNQFIFKHAIVEASTAVKGQIFNFLLDRHPKEEKFAYLDPDIIVISDLIELHKTLEEHDIVLTPHLTIPESKETQAQTVDAVMDNELCALQHGVYNLGFLAVRRSEESRKFINWWAERLNMFCYDDIPRGVFTDQRWIDLAPCFFEIFILKHVGYNVAPWNLSMRKITHKDNKYFSNGEPLRFFHFSGFDSGANELMINKYVPDKNNPIYSLRDEYVKLLKEHGQESMGKEPWDYDYFLSGEKIELETRIIFRNDNSLHYKFEDPFQVTNEKIITNSGILQGNISENHSPDIEQLLEKKRILDELYSSHGWKLLSKYYKLRDLLLPANSRRRYLAKSIFRALFDLRV